tara:strand:- start:11341 stop:11535 length:195 start_codon:yes stop_codon:yes gene_type:complete
MRKKLDQVGVLIWSEENGEGSVEIIEDFSNESLLAQLDVLKDWITSLTATYNELLQDFEKAHSD